MQVHILTGSHLNSAERLKYVLLAVESAQIAFGRRGDLHVTHHVSFSSEGEHGQKLRGALLDLESPSYGFCLYQKEEKTQQFDHLIEISRSFSFREDDILFFLDDDDLLLSLPPEFDRLLQGHSRAVKGFQYVPITLKDGEQQTEEDTVFRDGSAAEILEIIGKSPDIAARWQREVDFSGHIARYNVLSDLFLSETFQERRKASSAEIRHIETMMGALGDLRFMEVIDKAGGLHPASPFVYHRIWRKLGDSDWVRDILNGLETTLLVVEQAERQAALRERERAEE